MIEMHSLSELKIIVTRSNQEKNANKKKKEVHWADGKTQGPIENQYLIVHDAASVSSECIKKSMHQHLDNGYTESEAASLECSPKTLSGQLIYSETSTLKMHVISYQMEDFRSKVDDFYKDENSIHQQKAERDSYQAASTLSLHSNRFSFWATSAAIIGTAAVVAIAYGLSHVKSSPGSK